MVDLDRIFVVTLSGRPGAPDVLRDLKRRYAEPHRHYHTWQHVESVVCCLLRPEFSELLSSNRQALILAAFYHDAVYDATRNDNEERSAILARQKLASIVDVQVLGTCESYIRATKAHALSGDPCLALLLDADLAILGSDWSEYAKYSSAIRREYAHVPDEAFRSARADVLRALLCKEPLYQVELLREELEERARTNMGRELAELVG